VKTTLVILFVFLCALAFGQSDRTGTPVSWNQQLSLSIEQEWVEEVNVTSLLAEDIIQENVRTLPYRFAYAKAVAWTMENSGSWVNLENGDRLWILAIEYERARSISVSFEHLHLPAGGKLFVYSDNRGDYYGPLNGALTIETDLTLPHIRGERIFIEYYEPRTERGDGSLKVNYVAGAYRESSDTPADLPACAEWISGGVNQQELTRCGSSVMRVLVDHGQRYATSFLINNSQSMATPYAVMASSSIIGSPSSLSFQFGLNDNRCLVESSSCDLFTVNGAELVCSDSITGLSLLRLNQAPLAEEAVYYAGWNVGEISSGFYYCVQHPMGMAKSYAQYQGPFLAGSNDMHFAVGLSNPNQGSTSEGSVGSPLYDSEFKVIGVFVGGSSHCEAENGADYFVMLKDVWSTFKAFLDPLQTGEEKIPGRETMRDFAEAEEFQEWIVYPNPSSKQLQILTSSDLDIFQWDLYDASGRLQLRVASSKSLDVSTLDDGVYVAKAFTSQGVITTPVLISKK
jgi:hypothetical protein